MTKEYNECKEVLMDFIVLQMKEQLVLSYESRKGEQINIHHTASSISPFMDIINAINMIEAYENTRSVETTQLNQLPEKQSDNHSDNHWCDVVLHRIKELKRQDISKFNKWMGLVYVECRIANLHKEMDYRALYNLMVKYELGIEEILYATIGFGQYIDPNELLKFHAKITQTTRKL